MSVSLLTADGCAFYRSCLSLLPPSELDGSYLELVLDSSGTYWLVDHEFNCLAPHELGPLPISHDAPVTLSPA